MEAVGITSVPVLVAIIVLVFVNIVISSGALIHLVTFAKGYGALTEKVNSHETRLSHTEELAQQVPPLQVTVAQHAREIDGFRTFSHDVRDGKIAVKVANS